MELSPHFTLNTVTVFIGVLLFFYALFQICRRYSNDQKLSPPEAGGGLPLIGHLHLLGAKAPAHVTLGTMADAYGPIFTLRLGMHRTLVVSNWEIAKECFTINDKIFATRPKLAAQKHLGYDSAMLGFSPYGSYWRQVRKIITLEALSNNRMEKHLHTRKSEVQNSIRELYDLWAEKKTSNGEEKLALVEMKEWIENIALNTQFQIVLGFRFSSRFQGADDVKYRKAMRNFFELSGTIFVISDSFPFMKWMGSGGHEKAMMVTAGELDEMVDGRLKELKAMRRSGEVNTENDLMDIMLSIVEGGQEFPGYDSDTAIKSTCLSMILGGADTTTITMTWAISLLLNNPEKLKKVQHELEEHIGKERQVKESDFKNLVYLQAVVKETLRLYPPAPLLIAHESTEDCTVAGYHVAAGTRLFVNVPKIHRDPTVWENPDEFKPERFLTTHKDFEVRGKTHEFIPFGTGRRICPGISFAMQIMNLTLANVLHGFEFRAPSDEKINMEESVGLTNSKKFPLEVLYAPRLPANAYDYSVN